MAAGLTETPVDCGCDGPVLLVDAVTAATVVVGGGVATVLIMPPPL